MAPAFRSVARAHAPVGVRTTAAAAGPVRPTTRSREAGSAKTLVVRTGERSCINRFDAWRGGNARSPRKKVCQPAAVTEALTDLDAYERAARAAADPDAWEYLARGSGANTTLRENVAAWRRWTLLPHVLRDVSTMDLST